MPGTHASIVPRCLFAQVTCTDGTLAGQDPRPGSEPRILEVVQNLAEQSEMHGWCVYARMHCEC